jgi:transposase-like protein
MSKTKKQYSAAEKTKIALEAIKGELTIAQISSKYGVHATQISKWKQQAIESMLVYRCNFYTIALNFE